MARFLLDTSCMVAAVCGWHENHSPTAKEITGRLAQGQRLVAAAPALVEAYAVLTRLLSPHRLSPENSLAVIEANFVHNAQVVSLDNKSYMRLLHHAPTPGIYGGRSYDAVMAEWALQAQVAALLTLNGAYFKDWESESLKIIVPRT
ncbi:MAG TPA: PIN domain-containing protein [Terriglobia bacterium]|nr:PIN domain-containing protein [Terriglobia bacterium]